MKKLIIVCAFACSVLMITIPAAADITLTFEEFRGNDGALIGTHYHGIVFEAASTGQDWIASDVTTGNYNASSWPSGQQWGYGPGKGQWWMYDDAFTWTGVAGDDGVGRF